MRKIVGFVTVLFVLLSLPALSFISDFEGEADTVFMYQRWSGVTFPYVDGWYGRVNIDDALPLEVYNQGGGEVAYEGEHSLAIVIFDTATTDPGAIKWDFNSRPGEAGINHFSDVVVGDTIRFHLWIPPKYEIDTQLVYRSYSQYLDWSVWDADSIGIDSIYDNEGLAEGGWRVFDVVLPDTVGGSDVLAVGIQFEYPEIVNPNDIIYADYIYSTGVAGIPVSTDPGVLSLPKSSINNISYEISAAALVHVAVYNSLGQKVKEIVPGLQAAGAYSLGIDLAPGLYICKVTVGEKGKSTKLLILD